MRDSLRFLGLVTLAALVAGCSNAEDAQGDASGGAEFDPEQPPQGTGTASGTGANDNGQANKSADPSELGRPARVDELCDPATPPRSWFLSADDSNSMASPARARELLRLGKAPVPAEVRAHEFLNYYNVLYPAADGIQVIAQMVAGPGDLHTLLVTVQAAPLEEPRKKSLTLVVDTSGSMGGESIARAQAALGAIAGQLAAGDRVSLITWDTQEAPVLDGLEVQGANDPTLVQAIAGLQANGGSDLAGGLSVGYELAQKHQDRDSLNRLVLVSDGGASTADVNVDEIAAWAEDADDKGIYLVGVGTGPADGYDDGLMDQVTDAGRGAYVYLDSPGEADRVFGGRFSEVMDVAARDVQLELKLPSFLEIREFTGEGYSEDPSQIEPQHLAPGDSMAFHQILASTCDTANVPASASIEVVVTWRDRLDGAERTANLSSPLGELYGTGPQLDKASAVAAYARALATVDRVRLHAALDAAKHAAKSNPGDGDLTEIIELVQLHPAF